MTGHRGTHFRSVVELPLRDILRGATRAGEVSAEALRRALPRAPAGLADALERAARAALPLPAAGTLPPPARIAEAAAFLAGDPEIPAERFVAVLGAAVHAGREAAGARDMIFSETLAALALGWRHDMLAGLNPFERAAAVVLALEEARALGQAPGVPLPATPEIGAERRRALVGALLWLLSERAGNEPEERELLQIAATLAAAMDAQLREAGDDRAALARLMSDLAEIV